MAALTFTAPAQLCGDGLAAELQAAGAGPVVVLLSGSTVTISPSDDPARVLDKTAVGSVVSAHTGQMPAAEAAASTRATDASNALALLISLGGGPGVVRTKLKAVAAGTDTLTNVQVQRLLAAVVLWVLQGRSDS